MSRIIGLLLLIVSAQLSATAATLESDRNFIVMLSGNTAKADIDFTNAIRERANHFRSQVARDWLGGEIPSGVGRTVVHVEISETEDKGLTWAKDSKRNLHNVFLTTSRPRAVGTTLAHEMAHIVLATEFPEPNRLAPWVEEGIASQYDDPSRKEKRQQILAWFARSNNWPRLVELFDRPSISTNDQSAYSAASSVTELLVDRRDKQTFVRFAREAQSTGWDNALRHHYEIKGTAALERIWRQSLTRQSQTQ